MNGMRIWILSAVVLIAAILGLGWLIGLSPLLSQVAASDSERANVELANATQEATLAQMKTQHEHIDEIQVDLEKLQASISSTVDSDVIYALLAQYQGGSGAVPSLISLSEAVQYGVPVEGPETTAAEAPASGSAPSGSLATSLYTIPVTISFSQTSLDQVMAFVAAMQHGPRLFLVTSVTSTPESASITAYLFVIYDGTTAQVVDVPEVVEPTPEPAPTSEATPTPTATPTP